MKKIVLSFMAVLVAIFGVYISPNKVYAAENVSYDETTIISDLGSSFLSDYPADENGKLTVMSFQEYGYSSAGIGDYSLYFYLYNPTRKNLLTDFFRIEIATNYADGEPVRYEKKDLTFLSKTSDNLYYKLKLSPSTAFFALEQSYMQNYGKRRYDLVGVEVKIQGVGKIDYDISKTFYWTGYAIGCNDDNVVSTLSCTCDSLETIDVSVHHTVYRPLGDYYEGEQSQLNSCFFSVDNRFFEKYGDLVTISCEWYEYLTKPVLVTRNEEIYNKLRESNGYINSLDPQFLILALGNTDSALLGNKITYGTGWASSVDNFDDSYVTRRFLGLPIGYVWMGNVSDLRYDRFSAVFLCGHDYTKAVISSEELERQLLHNSSDQSSAYYIPGTNFYSELFEDYVCEGHTLGYNRKDVSVDEPVEIYFNKTSKSFWQTLFGGFDVETQYDSLKSFVTVTRNDISQKTNPQIAEDLKISVSDVPALRDEVTNAYRDGKQVILLRYSSSDYFSCKIVQSSRRTSDSAVGEVDDDLVDRCYTYWNDGEFSGYVAQETVFLDFDIISFTFENIDGVQKVVPVVCSPTNAISPITPPLDENYHNNFFGGSGNGIKDTLKKILMIILGVLAVVLIIFIVIKIAPLIAAKKQTRALKKIEKNQNRERDKKNE